MKNNKIFILLPDGIGLRNFAYTDFYKNGLAQGFDIVFWNNTMFDLSTLKFKEITIQNAKSHPVTDILKKARVQIDLNLNIEKEKDTVYNSYRFPFSYRNVKETLKSLAVKAVTFLYSSKKGVIKVRSRIFQLERKTKYYQNCLDTLKLERPAMIFCTNQRTVSAIAPILAAQDLGIPTATFIFSWDNLPKATLVLEPDYYFVWSEHMKKELRRYYPFINENQVIITGSPQFETHTYRRNIASKEVFFSKHNLDNSKRYICYSGDDITTSPNDPKYLEHTVEAVRKLNAEGHQLGIIFRRCPVDFSNRFDKVLKENTDIITAIAPEWKKIGGQWNAILPTAEDLELQTNTIVHTEMVINLGSSMVFDYISYNKPCAYINYDVPNSENPNWSVKQIYKFVHFRSMPSSNSVFWINDPESIAATILDGLNNNTDVRYNATMWFEKINLPPAKDASSRILDAIGKIINMSQKTILK